MCNVIFDVFTLMNTMNSLFRDIMQLSTLEINNVSGKHVVSIVSVEQ
jgi:hypothetical protein